ncbi:Uncharacterized conserved protein YabE, contains G5 and tandem DUF348 domains [Clostridium cavendishii DSM 21758]|uniref:Uncharacterized conserved protein YabE, contains G5 and tandem DUF348 domains n=1 Tax=Clostridium cavendishii DSM 21758 TaxID=1121302 RepID=A0A1M6D302_9CLOT|nr:3D domain-containing protein [Clostridium cavendishii]SHI67501.1 Uncharacterized conserved protein YabE, contains G5 and tandem DUF348 domains [Clostridium cavendishii DSM 21758]
MLKNIKDKLTKSFSRGKKAQLLGIVVIVSLIVTIYCLRKTVTVNIDGQESKIVTYKGTVQGALHDNNIVLGKKDKVEPGIEKDISNNGTIKIKRAVNVKVKVDDKELTIETAEDNIASMLKAEGINIKDEDKVLPSKDTKINKDLNVEIVRVEIKDVIDKKDLAFDVNVKKDDSLANSYSKVIQEGQNGEKEITTRIVYENGKEIDRKTIKEAITKEPVTKQMVQGTLKTLALSRGGELTYLRTVSAKATAYSGGGYTATGKSVSRNSEGYSTIAVDPSVIPLGTKVYIPGYGYAVACDTGGAIKGNRIDLYFSSSSEASNWGVRNVTVYLIK